MKPVFKGKMSLLLSYSLAFSLIISCSSKTIKRTRTGNIETIIAKQGGKPIYKILYTYKNGKIVRGEYWEPVKKKDKEAEKKTNILSDTAIAKKFEKMMSGKNIVDDSGINLDQRKDGFVLKLVKLTRYNRKGLPVNVKTRGFQKIPVLGFFNVKVDRSYAYNSRGQLISITEKNINVDSLLLNMALGNLTIINRDSLGRPTSVIKTIGSVPPTIEKTDYYYSGNSNHMTKTVYKKAGIDFKRLAIVVEKTLTFWYNPGVSWEGRRKYFFNIIKSKNAVKAFKIYNNIERKNELDFSDFFKISYPQKLIKVSKLAKLYVNELKGPSWRMGELPDVPEPYITYEDIVWW